MTGFWFGNKEPEEGPNKPVYDMIRGTKFVCGYAMYAVRAHIRFYSWGGMNNIPAKVALYDEGFDLVGYTDEQLVPWAGDFNWVTFNFTPPVKLQKNKKYYILVWAQQDPESQVTVVRKSAAVGESINKALTYDSWPDEITGATEDAFLFTTWIELDPDPFYTWYVSIWDALVALVKTLGSFDDTNTFYGEKFPPNVYPSAFVCPGEITTQAKTFRETDHFCQFEIGICTHNPDTKAGFLEAYSLAGSMIDNLIVDRMLGGVVHNTEWRLVPYWRGLGRGLETHWIGLIVTCQRKKE